MVTLGWFHCAAGASGDMMLGAVVDAGAPLDTMQSAIDLLDVERIVLSAENVTRGGLGATKVSVKTSPSRIVRTWAAVRDLLESAPLDDRVRDTARRPCRHRRHRRGVARARP
jgi:uncharacterized protein (DUF111 family)